MTRFTPGGDAKAISRIAQSRFGGFEQMFQHHEYRTRRADSVANPRTLS